MQINRAIAALFAALAGCGASTDVSRLDDSVARFSSTGPDVTCDLEVRGSVMIADEQQRPAMAVHIGRCTVLEDSDGHSRLIYPVGPLPVPVRQPTFSVTPGRTGGPMASLDLTPTDHRPIATPAPTGDAWRDAVIGILTMPPFFAQPFDALPGSLAATLNGSEPVEPAVIELARNLADDKGAVAVGILNGAGVLTCQMSLTDVGRAKLRAALDHHDAATRPAGAGLPPRDR